MTTRRCIWSITTQCRRASTASALRPIPILSDHRLETFRRAFETGQPALLPRGVFKSLPAVQKWFIASSDNRGGSLQLNTKYLGRFGSTIVPLEITNDGRFVRLEQSLSFFFECVNAASSTFITQPQRYFSSYVPGARAVRRTEGSNDFFSASTLTHPTAQIYLAQAPLDGLPQALKADIPTPEIVMKAGKGDIYDSSIWMGLAPTYTPLHRDPNPNLFVQLAGTKMIRIVRPEAGRAIFSMVQEVIGGTANATMRGEEMMQGAERTALEEEVWNKDSENSAVGIWQAQLESGDAIFIPKGWWHSIKGVGRGMNGSVNWWFRR